MQTEEKAKGKGQPLQTVLGAFAALLVIPFIALAVYLLYNINQISNSYNTIVSNITQVNEFNIVFKENMDAAMYLMIAHSLSKEEVEEEPDMINPDKLIAEAEQAFENVRSTTVSKDALQRAEAAVKLFHSLQKCVDEISSTVKQTGHYEENMERLDLDIRVLTEMIQERISEYIYHESVSMENIRQEMDRRRSRLMKYCVAAALLLIGFTALFSTRVAHSITAPIHSLVKTAEQIGRGNFSVRAKEQGSPEIRSLSRSFNTMAGELDDLVERNKQEQINLRNLELKLLQAQIDPHFLYNTLDNIVWLAEDDRKEDVEGIAEALSTFFRTSLSGGRDVIRIGEEERHIRSYLEIQQFRYRDMLTYEIDIDPECRDCMILKMTLQPIVENALYHGIKNKRGGGTITIRIRPEGNRIRIVISDTGIGMTNEQLTALVRMIDGKGPSPTDNSHFGLSNVAERLRLNYGESAGMSFKSVYGEGTSVEISIPKTTEEAAGTDTDREITPEETVIGPK